MSGDALDRAGIAARIPHSDRMCLLEAVEHWDEQSIRCRAISHRDADNPLRDGGRLSALSLIEYGAQAGAVHGGLLGVMRPGWLASLKQIRLGRETLDGVDGPLTVVARRLLMNAEGTLYEFEVHAGDEWLAGGRVAVMLR